VTGALAAADVTGLLAAAVSAAIVTGTAGNDSLRGTPKNDRLYGKAGSDRLYGLGGDDLLVGGPGADLLDCGPGQDVAQADALDKVNRNCETVKGLPKPPAASIADATVVEGASGTAVLTFPVTLSAASTKPVSVAFATADGTATAGSDYVAASGSLTFRPGEKSKTVDVTINGDTAIESDETFTVTISNPTNATLVDGSATGTIRNDDLAPHGGHYLGTTSQGYGLSFDVAGDGTSVAAIDFTIRAGCGGISLQLGVKQLTGPYPIAADRTFSASFDSGTGLTIGLQGSFDSQSKASGTVKVDLVGEGVNCSSGSVTWNAQ
jgi:chitinase